ncbi:MAG: hypothetical protein U0800_14470 [Isosphaeraceae bacterium]
MTTATRSRLRIWHLTLLPLLVAFAWANIQDQRIRDPRMMALAIAGFLLYGAIAWWFWNRIAAWAERSAEASRLADRVHLRVPVLALLTYLLLMAAFFVAASVLYVAIDAAWKR